MTMIWYEYLTAQREYRNAWTGWLEALIRLLSPILQLSLGSLPVPSTVVTPVPAEAVLGLYPVGWRDAPSHFLAPSSR